MRYYTHFITPGELPLDALTRFGINHKPNSNNPLGYFGTGLKYGVAIVLRLGGKVYLRTDKGQFEFYSKVEDFRGKDFQGVRMRRRNSLLSRWTYDKLPFTTELGKNWEPWQAYREYISNTFDENGGVVVDQAYETPDDPSFGHWHPGSSVLTVEMPTDVFNAFVDDPESVHLPADVVERGPVVYEDAVLVIHQRESKHVYYKGIRVSDFPHGVGSMLTYDFKGGVVLSEDRSVRNQWEILNRQVEALNALPFGLFERVMRSEEHRYESQHLPMSPVNSGFEKPNIAKLSTRPSGYYAGATWDYYNGPKKKPDEHMISVNITAKGDAWFELMTLLHEHNAETLMEVFDEIANDGEIRDLYADPEVADKFPDLAQHFV